MGTIYQLNYVRQLDMGGVQRAAQRDLPHVGPDYVAPRTPTVTPSFVGKYCTDKESMMRLTAVPLHKQKPKLQGSVSLPYAKRKKRDRFSFGATASGVVLPRPTSANAAASGPHASSRLSSSASTPAAAAAAAAAADDALEHKLLEARLATATLFRPRSYEDQAPRPTSPWTIIAPWPTRRAITGREAMIEL